MEIASFAQIQGVRPTTGCSIHFQIPVYLDPRQDSFPIRPVSPEAVQLYTAEISFARVLFSGATTRNSLGDKGGGGGWVKGSGCILHEASRRETSAFFRLFNTFTRSYACIRMKDTRSVLDIWRNGKKRKGIVIKKEYY